MDPTARTQLCAMFKAPSSHSDGYTLTHARGCIFFMVGLTLRSKEVAVVAAGALNPCVCPFGVEAPMDTNGTH